MKVLGKGVYSLAEAAKLTQLHDSRVRAWFSTQEDRTRRVFESDYPTAGGDIAISFLDLIEVFIVGRLRQATPPVSLQHIRKVQKKLSIDTGASHPFCVKEIYHGRGKIFTRSFNDESGALVEALTNQGYINEVIMPFLKKIEYDEITSLARLWHIAEGVVVDPERCFGKPIVEEVGIATRVLASAYEANSRDEIRVADWYEIEPRHVMAAVGFESGIVG
jgi:uncharacterized protein (DUF433 family)